MRDLLDINMYTCSALVKDVNLTECEQILFYENGYVYNLF